MTMVEDDKEAAARAAERAADTVYGHSHLVNEQAIALDAVIDRLAADFEAAGTTCVAALEGGTFNDSPLKVGMTMIGYRLMERLVTSDCQIGLKILSTLNAFALCVLRDVVVESEQSDEDVAEPVMH